MEIGNANPILSSKACIYFNLLFSECLVQNTAMDYNAVKVYLAIRFFDRLNLEYP